MQTVINVHIDELDSAFVETLKREFAHSVVEIRVQEPTDRLLTFTESDFWNAISLLHGQGEADTEPSSEALIAFLSAQPIAHIYRFSDILSEKLWHLDTYAHAKVFLDDPAEEGILSVDDFLYTRCAVVARGQAYYEKVLHNPALMPTDMTFESMLYIAPKAYKRRTNKDFTAVYAYNYETYSNQKGWEKQAS